MKEIELKNLVGLHILSGVETGYINEKDPYSDDFENCNYISFILDGTKYTAVEDPSDGYRSSMRYLKVSEGKLENTIPETQVFICMSNDSECSSMKDVAMFYATENAKLVLEVGTANSDEYYPSYIGHFIPENLPCNQNKENGNG